MDVEMESISLLFDSQMNISPNSGKGQMRGEDFTWWSREVVPIRFNAWMNT
jgi:hypothetical protein